MSAYESLLHFVKKVKPYTQSVRVSIDSFGRREYLVVRIGFIVGTYKTFEALQPWAPTEGYMGYVRTWDMSIEEAVKERPIADGEGTIRSLWLERIQKEMGHDYI